MSTVEAPIAPADRPAEAPSAPSAAPLCVAAEGHQSAFSKCAGEWAVLVPARTLLFVDPLGPRPWRARPAAIHHQWRLFSIEIYAEIY